MTLTLTEISVVIISIFLLFTFILYLRNTSPSILRITHEAIWSRPYVTVFLLLGLFLFTFMNDDTDTYIATISLIMIIFLTQWMIHPFTLSEHFGSESKTDTNLKLREMENLNSLYDSIDSVEKGMLSLPKQDAHIMATLAKMKTETKSLIESKSKVNKAMEHFASESESETSMANQEIDKVVKMIHREL